MKLASLCYIHDIKNDSILMLLRNRKENDPHYGYYNGLGGKFEEGESPIENVTREVFEESGFEIKNPKLKGIITFPNNYGKTESWHIFVYTVIEFSGKMQECVEGNLEWVPRSQLQTLKVHEADKLFLEWINEDTIFEAKFYYNDKLQLIKHTVHKY